ncbi:RNA-directed DNA polymerase from mobile element jockey [Trichonephila clavipes]|nr:RNA-directed DNA polymerase from mobile element jockey [Trichonephila clavipes]
MFSSPSSSGRTVAWGQRNADHSPTCIEPSLMKPITCIYRSSFDVVAHDRPAPGRRLTFPVSWNRFYSLATTLLATPTASVTLRCVCPDSSFPITCHAMGIPVNHVVETFSTWKEAIIFPILKPGKNKNIPSSYRPISLLSTLSKITESIILTRLKEFLYINNIIYPNQYGFTNKLSTLHPLLNLTEAISEGFQSKKSTGAVFLDIQKAFDRVWLTGLTYKLINYKIPPPLVFLLHSYNSNRSYQVRVKDTLSTTKFINCGVAQGSLLGPLLFNLYINDIPEYSLTKLNMYADDTAVHTTFKRITSVTFALNKHLKLLENYYDRWKISINVEKSAAVLFTKKRKIPPPPKMYNTTIPWSQSTKYLGITFDKNLTWKTHIQNTRKKFRKLMFKLFPLIGRNSDLSRNNKVLLFTAVMRPILSYGCPVWGYAAKTNINILDTLQNSTIRMIVKASRYMRNDDIRKALKIKSFKFYIQKIAKKFFNSLQFTNNSNMINLNTYTPHESTKRPRRILLDSYNPP